MASSCVKNEQFQEANRYFNEYFKIFDIKTIDEVENIYVFIYPMVKLYQTSIHLDKKDEIKELDTFVKDSILYFADKFKNLYHKQIEIEYDGYTELRDSDKMIDSEKYGVFVKLFKR